MEYDNEGKFALWANDKRSNDKQPHFKGKGQLNGETYLVAAWKSNSDNPRAPILRFSLQSESDAQAYYDKQGNNGIQQAKDILATEIHPKDPFKNPIPQPPKPQADPNGWPEDDIPF